MMSVIVTIKKIIYKIPLVENIFAYNRRRRDNWVQLMVKNISETSKVLDVGAGSCPYRSYFSHCEYKTHDFAQLENNQIQDEIGYGNIDFVSDILSIPVEDNSFDVILCTEVIEHVPYPISVIKEFSRILKPNGVLLLTAPLQSGLHQEPYHFYGGFTKYWYEKFLSENSFGSIEITPNGGLFTTYMSIGLTICKSFLNNILRFKTWKSFLSIILLVLFAPFIALIFPTFAFMLEKIYKEHGFTAGYHVKAVKLSK